MVNSEKAGALALNSIFGYNPKISKTIIDCLGSAAAVFRLSTQELSDLFGPFSRHRDRISVQAFLDAERQLETLADNGCQFVAITEKSYPAALLECEDPPAGLYVRSTTPAEDLFSHEPRISVVGTRDISPYGMEWCRKLVGVAASSPVRPVIVSGMAIGVDICAHRAALECGLRTFGVLPTGIDEIYPKRHSRDADIICSSPGCALLTDYPPGTGPQPVNFLRRNRIIAGLSQATVLVESKLRGGGTMTARLASGYGRDVLALPGRIDDVRSEGCNRLIAEKIAEPIDSLANFSETLGLGRWNCRNATDLEEEVRRHYGSRGPDEADTLARVASAVRKSRGITAEGIAESLGCPYGSALTLVSVLESDGFLFMDVLGRCTIKDKIV